MWKLPVFQHGQRPWPGVGVHNSQFCRVWLCCPSTPPIWSGDRNKREVHDIFFVGGGIGHLSKDKTLVDIYLQGYFLYGSYQQLGGSMAENKYDLVFTCSHFVILNPVPATCRRKDLAVESLKPQQHGCAWIIDWCDRAQPQDHSGEGFGRYCLHTNILDILSLFVRVLYVRDLLTLTACKLFFFCRQVCTRLLCADSYRGTFWGDAGMFIAASAQWLVFSQLNSWEESDYMRLTGFHWVWGVWIFWWLICVCRLFVRTTRCDMCHGHDIMTIPYISILHLAHHANWTQAYEFSIWVVEQ
jgi:hypothetical protein